MARRWEPDPQAPVGAREAIGRRLFEIQRLAGARDQKPWKDKLVIGHFLEKRDPGEVSLDRLGETFLDGKVRAFLLPRAQHDGTKRTPPNAFKGWAWISAGKLQNPPAGATGYPITVPPVPESAPGVGDHNPYHSHVCRRPGASAWHTATELRQLFHDHGNVEDVDPQTWWRMYARWLKDGLLRFRSHIWRR